MQAEQPVPFEQHIHYSGGDAARFKPKSNISGWAVYDTSLKCYHSFYLTKEQAYEAANSLNKL